MGWASTVKVPGVPGAVTLEVTFAVVNGTGTENAVGFTVTDWPVMLMNSVLLLFQVSPLPPANSPTPPSTRKRTDGVEAPAF